MLTEPRTDPEMRQALRKKYAETPLHCPYCDEPMLRETVWSEGRLAWCANELHWLPRFRPPADKDVLAAVDDAAALAGALAEVERLRATLDFYADPHTYLAHGTEPFTQSTYTEPEIEHDRGAKARVTLEQPADLRAALATSGTPAGMPNLPPFTRLIPAGGEQGQQTMPTGETGRADGENEGSNDGQS